jgi:hypothetical protein
MLPYSQLFNGTHPSLLVQVKNRLPSEFDELNDDLVRGDLRPNRSLQDELNVRLSCELLRFVDGLSSNNCRVIV